MRKTFAKIKIFTLAIITIMLVLMEFVAKTIITAFVVGVILWILQVIAFPLFLLQWFGLLFIAYSTIRLIIYLTT